MEQPAKKDPGPMVFTVIGIGVVLLLMKTCSEQNAQPRASYAEIKARAEQQVAQEERIARIEGRDLEEDIPDPHYRP